MRDGCEDEIEVLRKFCIEKAKEDGELGEDDLKVIFSALNVAANTVRSLAKIESHLDRIAAALEKESNHGEVKVWGN